MTITAKANGLTFSFPDGTTTAQIGEAIDGYFNKQPKETIWTDLEHGVGRLVDGWIHQGVMASPATADLMARSEAAGIHPTGALADSLRGDNAVTKLTPEPEGIGGTIISMAPSVAMSIPGWSAGVDGLAETALPGIVEKVTARAPSWLQFAGNKFLTGAAGTLGSDIMTGDDPANAVSGGLGNVVAETVLKTPQGLRLASALIQKNEQAIIDAADHIGVTPTAAMASMRKWVPGIEDLASKLPGGFLVTAAHKKVLDGLGAFSDQVKHGMGYKGDSAGLGESIRDSIDDYVQGFKDESEKAYDAIMKDAGRHRMTNTRRFTRRVQELNGVNPRPGISRMTTSPVARRYMTDLEEAGILPQNSGYGNVPMNMAEARRALKILDDHIGTGEHADADTADAKQLAAELRKDIGGTFEALGLGERWRAIQDRYAAQVAMIDQAKSKFVGAKTGEDFYRRVFGNPSDGFKPLKGDMRNALEPVLPEGVMNSIRGEIVHRMGLEAAGTAAAEGRAFSPAKYLTNWVRQGDEIAANELFGATEEHGLGALAKVSEGIKRAGKAVNHSNTASHSALWQMVSLALLNPIIGIPKMSLLAGGNALLSLALTHPESARILASAEGQPTRTWLKETIPMLVALSTARPELRQAFDAALDENKQDN